MEIVVAVVTIVCKCASLIPCICKEIPDDKYDESSFIERIENMKKIYEVEKTATTFNKWRQTKKYDYNKIIFMRSIHYNKQYSARLCVTIEELKGRALPKFTFTCRSENVCINSIIDIEQFLKYVEDRTLHPKLFTNTCTPLYNIKMTVDSCYIRDNNAQQFAYLSICVNKLLTQEYEIERSKLNDPNHSLCYDIRNNKLNNNICQIRLCSNANYGKIAKKCCLINHIFKDKLARDQEMTFLDQFIRLYKDDPFHVEDQDDAKHINKLVITFDITNVVR
jgi:hypothetical protein